MRNVPDGWSIASLGSVAEHRRESIQPAAASDARYVGLEHIDPGALRIKRWGSPDSVRSTKSRFYVGDILYAKLRPYLDKGALTESDGICSTDILVIAPTEAVDGDFLVACLHHPDFLAHATSTMRGVNHPRTSWQSLEVYPVLLPPHDEQRRIGSALQLLQSAVELQTRRVACLRELKAATLAKMFREGLRGEPPGGLRNTPFGDVPAAWAELPLVDCAEIQTGLTKGRLVRGRRIEVPYLRVANVQDGYLELSEVKTIELAEHELDRYALRVGDVVLTEGGDFDKLGRGSLWRGEVSPCVHQNHIFAVRPDRTRLLPEYLAYLVQSPYGKAYFLSVAHKTTNLASINVTKLGRLPVPLPLLSEQRAIAEIAAELDAQLDHARRQTQVRDALFKAMLPRLVTGSERIV